jgi:MerR family transcriptional regulator/heat shock protein HspR
MTGLPSPLDRVQAYHDAGYPAYSMGAAADAIGVTPAFLRSAEAAGLFEVHRSGGGHRRYSRADLERADRARQLTDEGLSLDAVVRIVALEYQLATAQAMIDFLRAGSGDGPA